MYTQDQLITTVIYFKGIEIFKYLETYLDNETNDEKYTPLVC